MGQVARGGHVRVGCGRVGSRRPRSLGVDVGSLTQVVVVDALPDRVWAAVRDVGGVHTRLLPDRVLKTTVEGDTRTLVMPDRHQVVELILDVDGEARRLAYCAVAGARPALRHHSASFQVLPVDNGRTRLV